MKTPRSFRALLIAIVALITLGAAAPANAAGNEVLQLRSVGKAIFVDSFSADDCSYTYIYIEAVDGTVKAEGKPSASRALYGFVDQYNYCDSSAHYGYIYGELGADALQVDKDLQSATLNVSAQLVNFYDEAFPIEINLTLTAADEPYREKSRLQASTRHFRYSTRFDGTTRSATPAGSVTLPWDTITISDGYASIRSAKASYMSLYKK